MNNRSTQFFLNTFSKRLAVEMDLRQLTQKELADEIGVSQPTVQRWLKGKMPDADELFRISEYLETPMTGFFDQSKVSAFDPHKPIPTGDSNWKARALVAEKELAALKARLKGLC